MGYENIPEEIIKLTEKYVKNVSERKNIFKTLRRKIIEKKIIKKLNDFYRIIPHYIEHYVDLFNNEIEFKFEKKYKNETENIEIIAIASLKVKNENNEIKLLSVKFEKSVNSIS